MATAFRKAFSQATITATRAAGATPVMATTQPRSVLCRHRTFSSVLSFHTQENNNNRHYSSNTRQQNHRNRKDHDYSDDIFDRKFSPSTLSSRPAKPEYNGDPDLYRIFFRSPDKMRSLEEAQVFINHIKSSYGPLTQYQFARCPETKKYFGYGFVTFKNKNSLDKALKDAYIRVGMKDFELIRSDNNNRNRKPVKHRNTGFSGFHDLEELRARKLKQQNELEEQLKSVAEIEAVEEKQDMNIEEQVSGGGDNSSSTSGEEFVSALPSSSTATSMTSADSSDSTASPTDSSSSVSKPYFVPLQKKGRAQLWKFIPNELERAEQTSKQANESDEDEVSAPKVDSKKLAAELVGDILNSKP